MPSMILEVILGREVFRRFLKVGHRRISDVFFSELERNSYSRAFKMKLSEVDGISIREMFETLQLNDGMVVLSCNRISYGTRIKRVTTIYTIDYAKKKGIYIPRR